MWEVHGVIAKMQPPIMAEPTFRNKRRGRWYLLGAILLAILAAVAASIVCLPAWIASGVFISRCPDGELRQRLRLAVWGAERRGYGQVTAGALAHYTTGDADWDQQASVGRTRAEVFLVGPDGKEQPLETDEDGWQSTDDGQRTARVAIPDVPDGDYLLRAKIRTPIEDGTIDLPLPLYAPARIHVITDRPLYQPGQTVKFRALALRSRDLAPLDGRPGQWLVRDPSGEIVLEEKAPAGDWGVAEGSFPVDEGATAGSWSVSWISGAAQASASFVVEPFQLPRFRLETRASRNFYRPGDTPRLSGTVRYSSGAPVAGAAIEVTWTVSGQWPPPASWTEGALPQHATAGPSGGFELVLPVVPADLQGQVTLHARLAATDPAGDRVEGSAALLLSEDAISVSAVTELGDGLVEGINNRLYLRVTRADGAPLAKTSVTVKRAWEAADPGVKTETDEDGVAALQIDPGPAVNVVIPPPPFRPRVRAPSVGLGDVQDLISGEAPPLADQRVMDVWPRLLEPCARFVQHEAKAATVVLRADPAGVITETSDDGQPLTRCLASALRTRRLPAGSERLYTVELTVDEPDLPWIEASIEGGPFVLDELHTIVGAATSDARSCLAAGEEESVLPRALLWRTRTKARELAVRWIADRHRRGGRTLPPDRAACVEAKLSRLVLSEPAAADTLGIARLAVHPAAGLEQSRPRATVMLGYELEITARATDEELGKTKLVMSPGNVPPVRLRALPVLAAAGSAVEVEILRGPGFHGKLPEKLHLRQSTGKALEGKLDPETRKASFTLPRDARGWFEAEWSGARAMVFVKSGDDLQVSLRPERDRYAPGELAKLLVETRAGARGVQAALSLIGVDESLSQLVPLPGPDELSRLRPQVTTGAPAFGVLDGQALSMGRIRGANAAQATVLRVTALPPSEEVDVRVNASIEAPFDPIEALTDRFYTALGELHAAVRTWEKDAPPDEQMKPETMARLWDQALAGAEKKGLEVDDAYGRRLRLSRLPPDLLALTAPSAVVVQGTRLPEDVESWEAWVEREQP